MNEEELLDSVSDTLAEAFNELHKLRATRNAEARDNLEYAELATNRAVNSIRDNIAHSPPPTDLRSRRCMNADIRAVSRSSERIQQSTTHAQDQINALLTAEPLTRKQVDEAIHATNLIIATVSDCLAALSALIRNE